MHDTTAVTYATSVKAQKPRVKVEGARKVWATHPHATVKTIENVVARFCSISEGLRIRRKTHRNGSSGKTSWWFIIHGNENVQCELDEKWDCVHLETSWILKPCTKPVDIDITDPISSTQTGDKQTPTCMQAEAPSELLHAVDRGEIYDAQVQDTSAGTQSSDSQSSITD